MLCVDFFKISHLNKEKIHTFCPLNYFQKRWGCLSNALLALSATTGITFLDKEDEFEFSCLPSNFAQILLVLKNLNVFTDLKSSTCSFGTCAISSSRSLFSKLIRVPPWRGENMNVYMYVSNYVFMYTLTSARVLSVTSITNSTGWTERSSPTNLLSIAKSTVAPKLSIFERKQYSRPSSMNFLSRPELRKVS